MNKLVIPDISFQTISFLREKGLLTESNGKFKFAPKEVYCLQSLLEFSETEYFKCLYLESNYYKMRNSGVKFTNNFLSQFVGDRGNIFKSTYFRDGTYIRHYTLITKNHEEVFKILKQCNEEISESVYLVSQLLYYNYGQRSLKYPIFRDFEEFLTHPSLERASEISRKYNSYISVNEAYLQVKEKKLENIEIFYDKVPSFQFYKKSQFWDDKESAIENMVSSGDEQSCCAVDILFPLRNFSNSKQFDSKQFLYQLYKEYRNLFGNRHVTIYSAESLQNNLNGFIYKKKNFKVIFLGGQNPCINLDGTNICSCEEYDRSYFCMSENGQILMDMNSYDLPKMCCLEPQKYVRLDKNELNLLWGVRNDEDLINSEIFDGTHDEDY